MMEGHVFCSLLLLKPEEMRGYLLKQEIVSTYY